MTSTTQNDLPVFKSEAGSQIFKHTYDKLMEYWPSQYETMEVETEYGLCHVIVSGPKEGKPILMFHGMTGNSAMWYPTIEALTDFRVYCIDTPGDFGKSRVVKCIRTPEDAVRWMDQFLDALGLTKATFIGHSMGGWFCSNYATVRPERIERLVLLAPVATFLPVPFLKLLQKVYPAMLWPKPDRIRRAWDWFCSKGYSLPSHVMNLVIAAYTHGRSQLPVVPRVIEKGAWSRLSAPVLFLVGDEEKIYNVEKVLKCVQETLQDSEVMMIRGAGHCLILEQKSSVNEAIRRFITKPHH
ncbi:alpha/beta hydrolase [Paenibacillus sediminis]|uniref:Pimeloyl-ACP methyl ester carboxylesterase n=1 Tax=Paenibacillus sediminis TaxID=664909 RepID=A0ABS4H3E5_9BACL|nr:alpha/beta hydrolase [Paenibacillus sediminis]MBP1937050.1 pimeloyl-ACP methyl ester carboxylesterase [Paenibacillus sediminis]